MAIYSSGENMTGTTAGYVMKKYRMCMAMNGECNGCPLQVRTEDDVVCRPKSRETVEIVEKWDAEHQPKTNGEFVLAMMARMAADATFYHLAKIPDGKPTLKFVPEWWNEEFKNEEFEEVSYEVLSWVINDWRKEHE